MAFCKLSFSPIVFMSWEKFSRDSKWTNTFSLNPFASLSLVFANPFERISSIKSITVFFNPSIFFPTSATSLRTLVPTFEKNFSMPLKNPTSYFYCFLYLGLDFFMFYVLFDYVALLPSLLRVALFTVSFLRVSDVLGRDFCGLGNSLARMSSSLAPYFLIRCFRNMASAWLNGSYCTSFSIAFGLAPDILCANNDCLLYFDYDSSPFGRFWPGLIVGLTLASNWLPPVKMFEMPKPNLLKPVLTLPINVCRKFFAFSSPALREKLPPVEYLTCFLSSYRY